MAEPRFIGADIYRGSSYGSWHPLRIPRVSTVIDLSRALGWLPPGRYLTSPRAKPSALAAFHTPGYIAALQQAERDGDVTEDVRRRHNLGTTSNPVYPEVFRRPATAAGASLLAGELLRKPGRVYSPAGGTHHGMPDRANGFCYLNDPVLAILALRHSGFGRIAYVDLDAHHPDGVEFAFSDDPSVLMVSVHEERRWPFTGALADRGLGQIWNLPVPRGFNDTEMLAVMEGLVLPRVAELPPAGAGHPMRRRRLRRRPALPARAVEQRALGRGRCAAAALRPGPDAGRRRLQPVVRRPALDRRLGHRRGRGDPRPPAARRRGRPSRHKVGGQRSWQEPARALVHHPPRRPPQRPPPPRDPRPHRHARRARTGLGLSEAEARPRRILLDEGGTSWVPSFRKCAGQRTQKKYSAA